MMAANNSRDTVRSGNDEIDLSMSGSEHFLGGGFRGKWKEYWKAMETVIDHV